MKNKLKIAEFEESLKGNKFKVKWHLDKSGYWFERKFPFPVFKHLICVVEPENNKMWLSVDGDEDSWADKIFVVSDWFDCLRILNKFNIIN